MIDQPQVSLARPEWNHEEYFHDKFKEVTILICQRNTRDLIQLCVTSILNHYPEIKILVADGNSQDESIEWLRFMSEKHPNVTVWETGERRNSHGEIMNDAIRGYINTKYVLLMDSDTIVRRGGFIELMLAQFLDNDKMYATGSLMLQSIKGEACSPPLDEADVLRYAHPSCSMYDIETYKTLREFTDHGAPCALNNIDAQSKGHWIEYFPVDKYVQHLCGASWQDIPTVWNDDGDIQVRPLVTFISNGIGNIIASDFINQQQSDYNIIPRGKYINDPVSTYDRGQIKTNPLYYDIRFRVNGYYICEVDVETKITNEFIFRLRNFTTENPNEIDFEFQGIRVVERKFWQKYISIK